MTINSLSGTMFSRAGFLRVFQLFTAIPSPKRLSEKKCIFPHAKWKKMQFGACGK
jgi:hypothetical protein